MAKVRGTRGGFIQFDILGVGAVVSSLALKGILISSATDIALVRAATFMQEEVKESISGQKAEPRSVDTGKFIRSVDVGPIQKKSITVETDVPYAKILEFGGASRNARAHFGNSLSRNKNKIRAQMQRDIKTFARL